MHKFLTISLSLISFCLIFFSGGAQEESAVKYQAQTLCLSSASDSFSDQLAMLRECGSDMLRSAGSRTLLCFEESVTSLPANHFRQRNSSESEIVPHVEPCRHLGHVNHIFDYDYFRSSLRKAYYLHALCRLRI